MTPTSPAASANSPRRGQTKERVIGLGSMVLFDIGLNILIFHFARAQGASEVAAYLLAMGGPAVSVTIEAIRHRRLSHVSVFVIALNLLSALVSLIGSTDPVILLMKDSALTGGLGLVILASLVPPFKRPLMFYMGQKFATDGSDEQLQWWRGLWEAYPHFRSSQRIITGAWGVAFLVEATLRVVAALTLPFDTAYTVGSVLPLAVTALVLLWTFWYARRVARAGQRRGEAVRAAAAAAAALEATGRGPQTGDA